MKDCKKCLNSRVIISEHGYHSICCLSQKAATDCMIGKKNHFVTIKRDEGGNAFEKLKKIAKDEFGVSIVKVDKSKTSQMLLDELEAELKAMEDNK